MKHFLLFVCICIALVSFQFWMHKQFKQPATKDGINEVHALAEEVGMLKNEVAWRKYCRLHGIEVDETQLQSIKADIAQQVKYQ